MDGGSYDDDIWNDPVYVRDTLASWSWDFGDGSQGSGRWTYHDFAVGSYLVQVTVDDLPRFADDPPAASNTSNSVRVYMLPLSITVTDDGDYTTSTTQLHATWTDCNGLTYEYAIGTTSGGTDVRGWTACATPYVTATGLSLQTGQTYYFAVRATGGAGCTSSVGVSDGITVIQAIHVKPYSQGGRDQNNGLSWTNAVATVQKGIDLAYAGGISQVWVAQGLYQQCITLSSGVAVYGGFTGTTETVREQRDWAANTTTIDGNQSGSVVTVPSGTTSAAIDGFTIQNGFAYSGGGIYCTSATATIANNIIRDNNGSGLYASGSSLTVAGNVFVENTTGYGGGIYYDNSDGQIANNTIVSNIASSDGGGVYLSSYSISPALSNNIIASNAGGGIYSYSNGDPPTFVKNVVYQNGKYDYSWTPVPPNDLILSIGTDLGIPNIEWGDWHIAGTSPCHDPQGTTLAVSMSKDIDAGNRIYGSTVDIGADEWNGSDPPAYTPTIIYVKPYSQGGRDSNNGTSWSLAVETVQKGIDLAYDAGGGEVWVAAGTYATANLQSFVKLYGGFAVGDSSKSARDWKTNQTVMDGGASGSVVTINSALGCVIDGFIIRNGAGASGTGIYCSSAIATIANNIIRGNNGICCYGGGIYASGSYLTLAGNVLLDNKAICGAGIYYSETNGPIANNTIISNAASNSGGGAYISSYYTSPVLSNNIIASNAGGGVYNTSGSATYVKNDVYGNSKYQYSWTTSYPVGTDFVPVDPVIPNIGWGDWHIAEASPCYDPEDTELAVSMDNDIDVGDRIYGSTVDIGADEWNGSDPPPPTPTVIYVKPDGSDGNNGSSWSLAVETIQKGIDLAYAAGGGEVWTAAGTYTKTGSASVVADMKSFVKLYGGFAVGDSSKSARNWDTNQTIMDGELSSTVVTMNSAVGCVIDGFTIRKGSTGDFGGGIYCTYAIATIANNIIRGNDALAYYGGGLYALESSLTVAGNVFIDNKAEYGSSIYYQNTDGPIANNTIISNTASEDYGAVLLYSYSSFPVLSNNIIAYNTGGGIYNYSENGSPTFTKNDVFGNSSYEYNWTTSYPVGTDLVPVDPVIPNIDYGDWHIAGTSPCHDPQGTTLAVSMDKDIDVGNRIYGSTVDIGADEWDGTDPPTPPGPPVEHPARWQDVSVHYSCPLVADLIPGDDGVNEVAVISYQRLSDGSWYPDGRAYIWQADGTLAWTSKDRDGQDLYIDYDGDNTLSAADIDQPTEPGNQHLELIAPDADVTELHAFGYDADTSTIKPLAGWPVTTPYPFLGVAAAMGDANLDGTREVVAGDLSCYVSSWSPAGDPYLWRQLTGDSGVGVDYSSVALGDVNHFADSNRIPDAMVGSTYLSGPLFAFCGDSWGTTQTYPSGSTWPKYTDNYIIESSPSIGLIDGDSDNDIAVGADNGKLYMWLSASQTWTGFQLASATDTDKDIRSGPVITELNSQRCVVVGCNNGRVYAVKYDGTPITGWPADGIYPWWRSGLKIIASPIIADVMNTGSPQIVIAGSDGNVYAMWADGNNHAGGPVAKVWVCAQFGGVEVDSTPTVCSLDGTEVSMIVGSTDGIYKIDLYSLQQGQTFVPNSARWPWPTFHYDNARTGCQTTPTSTMVSASIAGKITLDGDPVQGALIYIRVLPGLTLPGVYGRPSETRIDPTLSSGDATSSTDECAEGQYCISQLPPNQSYRIMVTDANGDHSTTISSVAVTTGRTVLDIQLTP